MYSSPPEAVRWRTGDSPVAINERTRSELSGVFLPSALLPFRIPRMPHPIKEYPYSLKARLYPRIEVFIKLGYIVAQGKRYVNNQYLFCSIIFVRNIYENTLGNIHFSENCKLIINLKKHAYLCTCVQIYIAIHAVLLNSSLQSN